MVELLSPVCPVCGSEPGFVVSPEQAFCGEDDCPALSWNMTKTRTENLDSVNFLENPFPGVFTLRSAHDSRRCHRRGMPHLGRCIDPDEGVPFFTCPDCLASSQNPNDVQYSYCFRCHAFKTESHLPVRCFEPSCVNFGDCTFGGGTCPVEHAVPPAHREGS